jgi:hypothetical protein
LDDNGNVTFFKIIEAPELTKDEIFNRALNYFIYNYISSNSSFLPLRSLSHFCAG